MPASDPEFLSALWLAEEFATIEAKDHRVYKIRISRPLPKEMADSIDREDGKTFLWNAQVVIDKTLKAGTVVFEHKLVDYDRVPAKTFKKTVQARPTKPRGRSSVTSGRGASR